MRSKGSMFILFFVLLAVRTSVSDAFVSPPSPRVAPQCQTASASPSISCHRSNPLRNAAQKASVNSSPLSTRSQNSKLQSASSSSSPPTSPSPTIERKRTTDSKKRLLTGLAFLTGWSDVALIFKHKSFATMMTGNTMWMASATIESRYRDALYYASLILSYAIGVASFRRADVSLKERSLKVCSPVAALLFVGSDTLSYVNPSSHWIPMMLLSAAFGMVNSVGTEVGGTLAFVLTGHLTKITNLIFDRVSRTAGRKRLTEKDWEAARQSSLVMGAFFVGALWACQIFDKFPQFLKRGAFSAIGLLYGLLFFWQDRKTLGAWWMKEDPRMCDYDEYETTCE